MSKLLLDNVKIKGSFEIKLAGVKETKRAVIYICHRAEDNRIILQKLLKLVLEKR